MFSLRLNSEPSRDREWRGTGLTTERIRTRRKAGKHGSHRSKFVDDSSTKWVAIAAQGVRGKSTLSGRQMSHTLLPNREQTVRHLEDRPRSTDAFSLIEPLVSHFLLLGT